MGVGNVTEMRFNACWIVCIFCPLLVISQDLSGIVPEVEGDHPTSNEFSHAELFEVFPTVPRKASAWAGSPKNVQQEEAKVMRAEDEERQAEEAIRDYTSRASFNLNQAHADGKGGKSFCPLMQQSTL